MGEGGREEKRGRGEGREVESPCRVMPRRSMHENTHGDSLSRNPESFLGLFKILLLLLLLLRLLLHLHLHLHPTSSSLTVEQAAPSPRPLPPPSAGHTPPPSLPHAFTLSHVFTAHRDTGSATHTIQSAWSSVDALLSDRGQTGVSKETKFGERDGSVRRWRWRGDGGRVGGGWGSWIEFHMTGTGTGWAWQVD